MSVDRTKVLESAQKHLAKGNYDRAIAELKKLVRADPSDIRTWLKIGDLYTRKGARPEAMETYGRVASTYGKQGFFVKAVAVYKQMAKLDPSRLDVQLKLAEMYEMLQHVNDALTTYEQVAAGYAKAGDIDRALAALAKMTELDPENIPVRIKSAEALSRAGRTEEAAEEFAVGAQLLKDDGRIDDYIKVAERLLYHRPDDVTLARELAQLYLERSDPKRALSKLQTCFKADPKDISTLELLAEAFRQLGQLPKTISVYREVARIHGEAKRDEPRARILTRILELDPSDQEARQALAKYAQPEAARPPPPRRSVDPAPGVVVAPPPPHRGPGHPPAPVASRRAPPPAPPVDDDEPDVLMELEELEDSDDDLLLMEEDEYDLIEVPPGEAPPDLLEVDEYPELQSAPPAVAPGAQRRSFPPVSAGDSQRPSVPPDVQHEAQLARLLTECDVFLRYGLKQKVVEQLHAVLQIEPTHIEAHERLKEVYLQEGFVDEAVNQLLRLADILAEVEGEIETAEHYLREAVELNPSNMEALDRLDRIGRGLPSRPSGVPSTATTPPPRIRIGARPAPPGVIEGEPPAAPDDDFRDLEPPSDDEQAIFFVEEEDEQDEVVLAPPSAPPVERAPSEPPLTLEIGDVGPDSEPVTDAGAPPSTDPSHLAHPALDQGQGQGQGDVSAYALSTGELGDAAAAGRASALGHDAAALLGQRPARPEQSGAPSARGAAPAHPASEDAASTETTQRISIPPPDLEELLDEIDFYVAQGLLDEARSTLGESAEGFSNHPLVLEKIAEVEALIAQEHADRSASAPPESDLDLEDESFLLAERLAEEFEEVENTQTGQDVLDVEQVFAQFKQGVAAQVATEDTDTHFDLGIAYKEMGLLDDAIAEFGLCVVDPTRFCISETMIGLCLIEKGDAAGAIEHFKAGLSSPTKSEREELGLYYELGAAFELLGNAPEAVRYFRMVDEREPGFRGVKDRILRLSQASAAPAPAGPDLAQDDIDRAFDDLMGED